MVDHSVGNIKAVEHLADRLNVEILRQIILQIIWRGVTVVDYWGGGGGRGGGEGFNTVWMESVYSESEDTGVSVLGRFSE